MIVGENQCIYYFQHNTNMVFGHPQFSDRDKLNLSLELQTRQQQKTLYYGSFCSFEAQINMAHSQYLELSKFSASNPFLKFWQSLQSLQSLSSFGSMFHDIMPMHISTKLHNRS